MDYCDSLDAKLPIFEQRFNVSRYVRSLHLKQMKSVASDETYSPTAKSHNSNPEVCDEKIAAGKFWLNGLHYFANARYDFPAKIWISPGLKFSPKILPAD